MLSWSFVSHLPDPSSARVRDAKTEKQATMDLIEKFPFRQIVHLIDEATDFCSVIALQIFFGDRWRRTIGECLDPHP